MSPLSGVIHGIFVLITLLLLAPLAVHIPLASLAPVLMMVAWNMSERHHFVHILKLKSGDSLVLCITFLLTVFMSLTVAVMAGLILAVILFAKSMSDSLTVSKVLPNLKNENGKVHPHIVADLHECPQISIYTIEGPLFFGAAEKFEQTMLKTIQENPKVFILRMRKVPYIDSTGEEYFRNILQNIKASGGIVFLTNVQPGLEQMLKRSGLYNLMEEEHFYHTTNEAISAAFQYIQLNKCIGCTHYELEECRLLSNGVPLPEQELLVQKKLTEATI